MYIVYPLNEIIYFEFNLCSKANEIIMNSCCLQLFIVCNFITNLLGFIGSFKFHAKSSFDGFKQKSHEFHAMFNMNDICTCSIS